MYHGRLTRGQNDRLILGEREGYGIGWLSSIKKKKSAFIVMLCAVCIHASNNWLTVGNVIDAFTREMEEAAESVKMYVCGSKSDEAGKKAIRHKTINTMVTKDLDSLQLFGILVDVYDGDTIKIEMEKMPLVFGHRLSVRLAGIDTPEIRGSKCIVERCLAVRARTELCRWLGVPDCIINTNNSSNTVVYVALTEAKRGKYFRLVARVSLKETEQQRDASENMLATGWAVPYDGKGKRHDWCASAKNQPTKEIATHVRECMHN